MGILYALKELMDLTENRRVQSTHITNFLDGSPFSEKTYCLLKKTYAGCKMHKLNRDYFSLILRTVLDKGKIVPMNLIHFSGCVGFF